MSNQPLLAHRPLRLASAAVAASLTLTALAAAADRPPKPVPPTAVVVDVKVDDAKLADARPTEGKAEDGKPRPRGERAELFRRLCLDVTGRMPTEKEFADFLADESPNAFRNALDRIVAADGNPKREPGKGGGGIGGGAGGIGFEKLDADRAAALDRKTKALGERVQEEKARADRAVAEAREALAAKTERVAKSAFEAKRRADDARDLAVATQARKATDSFLGWARTPQPPPAPKQFGLQPPRVDAKGDVVIRIPPGNNPSAVYATLARKAVPVAYLGVGVESPGETLRSQLELGEGAGLVVNHVDDSGPTKSLVRQHDVLRKLDDQILVNAEQLVALVRMHKPGEAVELTVIRAAKPVTVTVKLGERQVQVGQADAAQGVSGDVLYSTFTNSSGSGGGFVNGMAFVPSVTTATPATFTTSALTVDPRTTVAARAFTAGPIRVDDGEWSIELPPPGGPRDVTLTETRTGKVIYQGPPVTQDDDPHAPLLPPEARKKLIVWQKALLDPRTVDGNLLVDPAADGTTTVVGSKLANPATQPANDEAGRE